MDEKCAVVGMDPAMHGELPIAHGAILGGWEGLLWADGKGDVSSSFDQGRELGDDVRDQIRQGWRGKRGSPRRALPLSKEGGCKPRHPATGARIEKDGVSSGASGPLVIPDTYRYDAAIPGDGKIEDDVNTGVIMGETLAGGSACVEGVDEGRDGIRGQL